MPSFRRAPIPGPFPVPGGTGEGGHSPTAIDASVFFVAAKSQIGASSVSLLPRVWPFLPRPYRVGGRRQCLLPPKGPNPRGEMQRVSL